MRLSDTEDHAIQALIGRLTGALVYDRLFAGVRFDEVDEGILFLYVEDEDLADEIELLYTLEIASIAEEVLKRDIDAVMVLGQSGNQLNLKRMATREHRIAEFSTDAPAAGAPMQLLCEDHAGTYVLPFAVPLDGWRVVQCRDRRVDRYSSGWMARVLECDDSRLA